MERHCIRRILTFPLFRSLFHQLSKIRCRKRYRALVQVFQIYMFDLHRDRLGLIDFDRYDDRAVRSSQTEGFGLRIHNSRSFGKNCYYMFAEDDRCVAYHITRLHIPLVDGELYGSALDASEYPDAPFTGVPGLTTAERAVILLLRLLNFVRAVLLGIATGALLIVWVTFSRFFVYVPDNQILRLAISWPSMATSSAKRWRCRLSKNGQTSFGLALEGVGHQRGSFDEGRSRIWHMCRNSTEKA